MSSEHIFTLSLYHNRKGVSIAFNSKNSVFVSFLNLRDFSQNRFKYANTRKKRTKSAFFIDFTVKF
ncbi:MAG: hypothetical protein DBX59_01985 [Bacillota bacterium]|nr:MAG: hypothetical protein DBX59_01985 [Bacillota bacterium]